tara:strand:+ start:4813 stop:5418 length:606 start_codon:yes stop_codon:yes gene_type:complete
MTIELLNQRVQLLEKQLVALMSDNTTNKNSKKDKTDAPKIKRTSGWILFQTANREQVKERLTKDAGDEKANPKDVMTELAKMWKALSDEDKTPYNEKAKHVRDEQSSSDTEVKAKKPPKKDKKEKDDNPKKKRVSGYILFQKAMRDEAKQSLEEAADEDEPKIKQSAVLSELGRMWKALSDEEREEWNEKAAEQKASDSEE